MTAACMVALLAMAGCAAHGDREGGMRDPAWLPSGWLRRAESPVGDYLALAAELTAQPEEREALAEAVVFEFDAAPTAQNRMRLAIVQATPGHATSDPGAARENFEFLLALSEVLEPAERHLAHLYMANLDRERVLAAEIKGLRSNVGGLQGDVETLEVRLAELRDDVQRLNAQIRSLTDVERTIDERERVDPAEPVRNPPNNTRR
jgi:hypothetical protein